MKVLYFSRSFIPSHEANSIHVMNMSEALSENGHEVELICPRHSDKSTQDIFKFYGVKTPFHFERVAWPKVKGRALLYALLAIPKLMSYRPDLVVSRFPYGSLLASWLGFSFVHDFHDKDWENGAFGRFIFKSLIHSSSMKGMTFNSKALLDFFMTEFPEAKMHPERYKVLHNGAKNFSLTDKAPLPGAQKYKVGYFGNLYRGRGIELILDLAGKLLELDFIIVGGSKTDLDYWKSQKLPPNIYFVGFVDPLDVYRYRNSCDALLAPYGDKVTMAGNTGNSVDYMNPIKLFEYMSSRKPILTSDLKAIREVFSSEEAWLLNYHQPESWVTVLKEISQHPESAQNKADLSYQKFITHYTWKARAEKIVSC